MSGWRGQDLNLRPSGYEPDEFGFTRDRHEGLRVRTNRTSFAAETNRTRGNDPTEFKRKHNKFNEGDCYSAAHNGLVSTPLDDRPNLRIPERRVGSPHQTQLNSAEIG